MLRVLPHRKCSFEYKKKIMGSNISFTVTRGDPNCVSIENISLVSDVVSDANGYMSVRKTAALSGTSCSTTFRIMRKMNELVCTNQFSELELIFILMMHQTNKITVNCKFPSQTSTTRCLFVRGKSRYGRERHPI